MTAPWLTIIGIGDNSADSLSAEAREALDSARTVLGAQRVLDRLELGGKEVLDWSAGVAETIAAIKARRRAPLAILATGDPMHFGVGATLLRHFESGEMRVLPAPSAFSLAAARLGWPLPEAECISLHGREVERLAAHLGAGRKIIALTSSGETVREAAALLTEAGYGASALTVLEHMGGPEERVERFVAAEIGGRSFADFNTLAIECTGEGVLDGTAPGLPDEAFRHDGQLTKQEVRAVAMAHLRPGGKRLLWDIGAGCGSVSIEWMRASATATAIAIEPKAARREMIRDNARRLGTPHLTIVDGAAPEALTGLPPPDAVFIGGGISADGVFEAAWQALRSGGPLVATAVTLESEARLAALHQAHGGKLLRIAVSRAEPIGRFTGWKPFMPVTIWAVQKERQP